jgi:NADH:ubiquinone oxidoreductase subunit D
MEDLLPGVERVPASLGPSELGHRLLTVPLRSDEAPAEPQTNPITVPIPGKKEREIATEPVVLSLGPVQPLTAGPLRLLLTADGEQIVSARIEAGYAARDVARAMSEATVPGAAALASSLDPLAPVAGRLAYVIALEQLQHWGPDPGLRNQREAVLALERAQNYLAWLVRFAELVDDDRLAVTAEQLNAHLADATAPLSERLLTEWVVPQGGVAATQPDKLRAPLDRLIAEVVALRERLEGDRLLALRTAGIGAITVDRLQAVGASGPVLHASERGRGDVLGRLLTRLDQAADDLRQAADFAPVPKPVEGGTADWSAPPGRTEVEIVGPRGHLRLSLMSDSGRLREVNWQRPSAALLNLIPELLAGQKLPCAEVIVASLDLAMAEADG